MTKRNFIFAGVVGSIIIALAVMYQLNTRLEKVSPSSNPENGTIRNMAPDDLLRRTYQSSSTAIVLGFVALQNETDADVMKLAAAALKAKNDLLALVVPVEYKDLHLSLVIAFTRLVDGYEGQTDKLPAAKAEFAELSKGFAE